MPPRVNSLEVRLAPPGWAGRSVTQETEGPMILVTVLLALVPALSGAPARPVPSRIEPTAFAIMSAVTRLAARPLWPGYDPTRTPVAIYDGDTTWLFRHPAPPDDFRQVPGRPGVLALPGRYPAVSANTSIEIGGVQTATVLLDRDRGRNVDAEAALVIHEAFHAFQRARHPKWAGNEADLLVYPVTDTAALALRRLETGALRRAVDLTEPDSRAAWAAAAIALRRERFARLPGAAVAYERGTELNEGLAQYVQYLALGRADSLRLPENGFPAGEVRQRSYATGQALAVLLDRFRPGWKSTLESDDSTSLDSLLADALTGRGVGPARLGPDERSAATVRAASDIRALVTKRAEDRREYLARSGWRLVLEAAPGQPLWPQGFDPLDVERVGPSEVLHTRFLKLGNDAGTLEVLDRAALTDAAGDHPLFNGVAKLLVTGLDAEPTVEQRGDTVRVTAPGVTGEFRGATVERTERAITIRL